MGAIEPTARAPMFEKRSNRFAWPPSWVWLILLAGMLACSRGDQQFRNLEREASPDPTPDTATPVPTATNTQSGTELQASPTASQIRPLGTPTPDPTRIPPPLREAAETYVVQPGDSLKQIAVRYNVGVNQIQEANELLDPNFLGVGWILTIPPPIPQPAGPSYKIIPDSELIYGPTTRDLSLEDFVPSDSQLRAYSEDVDGQQMNGLEIVDRVARNFSINPKVLLSILEYQSGWLRGVPQDPATALNPLGKVSTEEEALQSQVWWAADQLNSGFYRWRSGWSGYIIFPEGGVVPPGSGLNAGSFAIQYLFSQLYPLEEWREVVAEGGFDQVYRELFGNPFSLAIEPLLPLDLSQPTLQLPFEEGKTWSFTGGPHSSWGNWAAWGGLDFAPPGYALGCVQSQEWVVAVADGIILRSEDGAVVQDLDQDGFEQTGWTVLYLHVEARDRVQEGANISAGERIGHPSCEGGVSTGTHLHLSRKYNGVWISADGLIPFNLDGWKSTGSGIPYEGSLTKGWNTLQACSCRASYNQISR